MDEFIPSADLLKTILRRGFPSSGPPDGIYVEARFLACDASFSYFTPKSRQKLNVIPHIPLSKLPK